MIIKWFFLFGGFFLLFTKISFAEDVAKDKIEQILELKGEWFEEEGVFKITFPRNDVKVVVDDWTLPPFMGLSSWVSFTSMGETLISMGDLVLFEDEVNPVMRVALANGLSVTALHNHFFFDHPKVYFMHIAGKGDSQTLSIALKRTFDQIKSIRAKNPVPVRGFKGGPIPSKNSISKELVQNSLGVNCQEKEGMVKAVIGRTIQMSVTVGKNMGINSWAAFAGTEMNAIVDGDIAVLENELQDVLNALQNANIDIVAIHNHMINEEPRMLFLHYWGKGNLKDLVKGVKSALILTNR